jgi:toxin ParE1/3/4
MALDNPAARELIQRVFRVVDQLIIHPAGGSKPRELRSGRYGQTAEPPCRIFYRREGETVFFLLMRGERKLRPSALEARSKKDVRYSGECVRGGGVGGLHTSSAVNCEEINISC